MGVSAISDLETVHKVEYVVSDLNTSSVTLFPSRAQVHREIKGIQLKRGTNEVTIVGLSQTADPDSIRVESNGTATVTNLEVESVPNRQRFDEVYPESESESESESDDDDHESSDDEVTTEDAELAYARGELEGFREELATVTDDIGNAQKRLYLLEQVHSLNERKNNDFIQATLEQYKEERSKAFQDLSRSLSLQKKCTKLVEQAEKKVSKLQRAEDKRNAKENKAKARARKEKQKKKALKERLKAEARRERQRLREEQQDFWPLEVLSVRITLEVVAMTPMTSRRGSTSSDADVVQIPDAPAEGDGDDAGPVECNLAFSYVTSSAYWTPSYDLQLSTTNASASLYFDAMLTNQTSESWKSCKVTLSTSQATFSGLYDTIPKLNPWRIKLASRGQRFSMSSDITRSAEEVSYAMSSVHHAPMLLHQDNARRKKMSSAPPPAPGASAFGGLFGSSAGPFGSAAPASANSIAAQYQQAQQQQAQQQQAQQQQQQQQQALQSENVLNDFDFDAFLNDGAQPNDGYDASLVEETGLTTTYDLPGLKTLVPKNNGSKQRVARIPFSNVAFSHTVVPKYKPVAYLKAKLKNGSKMALLKGGASLTLDGTFLGKTSLPRCSSGESFSLSLGVDPAIKVTYSKPEVRRTTAGLFGNQDSSVYVRAMTLHNTRAVGGRAVALLVLDQVPVSEDEKLRVEVSYPRGLTADGTGVACGEAGKEGKDEGWGKAVARLKKEGLVSWDVTLNAGKTVKLSLEYVVSLPSGETAHQV
ncbi:hypothetical protein BBK36DRAFT_1197277 [Trichoderma citrinoviride]|uniref:DUF4139 domain-containing protein n=1 Tax=Trichoderma citrinoviride TaxID=58853 RepID=A0A2T4BED3_9HYPO|nr:hypothetical protein BBK36DRAFT_1197277 [Trichoderma citrinoviride]PTB67618.1 hypothetical protein BBK36DRAFT_1197277 [Trichoderma citrinoviride]